MDYHGLWHRNDMPSTQAAALPRIALTKPPTSGQTSISMASPKMPPTKPLDQKMDKLPCDISMDWRKLASAISPKTSASTKGAMGYLSFLNK